MSPETAVTTAAQANPTAKDDSTGSGIPWPLYLLAPFVLIPGILLGLWMWPAIAFAALTIRRALKITSNFRAVAYACLLAVVFVASLAWPFGLTYLLSEVL